MARVGGNSNSVSTLVGLVLVLALAGPCHGHPSYAGNKTLLCTTMEPGHGAVRQLDADFPAHFKLSGKAGSHTDFIVGIEALQKEFGIKGYMIQARSACTGEILNGQWTTAEADQIMRCNGATGINAVHHRPRKSVEVQSISHTWSPIDKVNEITSLQFMATVVNNKSTYWTKQSIEVIPCSAKAAAAASAMSGR